MSNRDTAPLSTVEWDLLWQTMRGVTSARDQARAVGVAPSTIRNYWQHIYKTLGVRTRAEAVTRLWQRWTV